MLKYRAVTGEYDPFVSFKLLYCMLLLCKQTWKGFQSTGRTRRICSPTAVSKRSYFSSKQNKFKLLACLTLILQWKQTAGASLQPLIDLDLTTNNQIKFQIPGNHSLMLFRNPQAMVLYSTSLDYNRQLVQIDRIVDFTQFALSNMNLVDTLSPLVELQHFAMPKNSFIYKQSNFLISTDSMDYSTCQYYCASNQAAIINAPRDFYAVRKRYPNISLWVDSQTTVKTADTNRNYTVLLGEKSLYPDNNLTYTGAPRILYQKEEKMVKDDKIEKFYYGYYNGQDSAWWPTHAYKLISRISKSDRVEIIIPTPTTVLDVALAQCPCVHPLNENKRLFADMRDQLQILAVQREELGFFLETLRLKTGYVPRLLRFTQLAKNHSRVKTEQPYRLKDFAPLTAYKEKWINNEKADMALAPVILQFVATKIGTPMMLSLFKPYFMKVIKDMNAHTFKYLGDKPTSLLPTSVKLSGIDVQTTNFSIIFQINDLHSFEDHKRKSFTDNTRILRNMSLINTALGNFLQTDIEQMVIKIASENISETIDRDYPVLVSIEKSDSFWLFKIFFTIIMNTPTSTTFSLFNLPTDLIDDKYYASDMPTRFSSDGFQYQFDQTFANKGLAACIDNILAGSYSDQCTRTAIQKTKIVKGFRISVYNVFYILTDSNSHLKITCPGQLTHHNNLKRSVTVIAVSPACNIALLLATGTLNIKQNNSYAGRISPPILLFEYDINARHSDMDFHLILIITIGSAVLVLIIVLISIAYYILHHKTTEIIEMHETIHTSTPTSSETSVETIRSVTRSPRVHFNTTI